MFKVYISLKMFNCLNMYLISVISSLLTIVLGGTPADTYKDQFCTDPRTMQKHAAYSEWPDSYSCTRHRCQPGGRNLAIYTVGCKRVEAPESAIECEEVVEDTNMQFPYCCTRLRCLVVVRGEVWTRVLGQPWETLPAAPWSHMYKMKRPPPSDSAFVNKNAAERGPVYELLSDGDSEKTLRASKKSSPTTNHEPVARAVPSSPDIVIALATPNDEKKKENFRSKKARTQSDQSDGDEDLDKDHIDIDLDDVPASEKGRWTEIPPSQWNEHDPAMDVENSRMPIVNKASGLQALVDAIGTRMRDIESVVQRMTEQVQNKPEADLGSGEKRSDNETPRKHEKSDERAHEYEELHGRNKASPTGDHYKRFSIKNRSEYLRNSDATSERPVSDDALNGYFSDASNSVGRRSGLSEEPAVLPTYVAPVENRHRSRDASEEAVKKHKKHLHKKKRKGKGHKKHHKDDKKKHQSSKNRLSSSELDKAVVSLEDSSNL